MGGAGAQTGNRQAHKGMSHGGSSSAARLP